MKHITLTDGGTYTYTLSKAGEELDIRGRFKLKEEDRLDLKLIVIHQAPQTKSTVSLKTVAADHARVDIQGTIIVEPTAHASESFLEERVLLLSPYAAATAVPNLEIKTHDVKCAHAATVGQLDPEQLFYLTSRGIPVAASEDLLTAAFLTDTISN